MKLKLLTLLLISGLMINVGCSSSNDGDSDMAEGTDPALDTEGAESEEIADEDDIAEDEDVASGEEGLPEESLEEDQTADNSEEVVAEGEELADGSRSTEPEAEEVVTADTGTEAPTSEASTDENVFSPSEETPTDVAASTDESSLIDSTPKPAVSLKKIKDVPYTEGDALLNTVYLARQGDSWKSVAEKIYGDGSKAKDLKKSNPYLSYRNLKVGDKVYYNSPKRPQDAERMLTYYEDNGMPAQTYIAKAGENIRDVSQQLLGDTGSWKEVWATNLAVESKGELQEGTELRYWIDTGSVAQTPVPTPEAQMAEPQAPAVAQNAPVQDDFSLPDEMNADAGAAGAGTMADAEPPPPPPPPPAPKVEKTVASNNPMGDKDMTFILAAGGLLLAGIGIILSIIKKNKARKMNMSTNTQI